MADDSKSTGGYLNIFETDDPDKLASAIESFYNKDVTTKLALAYHWQRNQLMVDGQQWLYYDKATSGEGGNWKPVPVSAANEWVPKPVTNYMFDSYQTLKSYLVQNRPQITVEPNTQLWSDKEAAKLASLVSEATWARLKENQNYEYAASCGVMYGTVFKKDYWDTNTVQMAEIPKEHLGQSPTPEDPSPTIQVPVGDVNTSVVEPFRIAMDPLATDIHTARWIMEYSIQPLEWVKQTYGKQGEGYTGLVEEIQPDTTMNVSLERFTRLKNSSGTSGGPMGTVENGSDMPPNSVIVKEYYEKPTARYPKGRMIVVAAKQTLYVADSPYEGDDVDDWHPYSEFRWEIVPGRFWGKSPLDAVAELNKRINSIDSAVILSRKTMANPKWVVSKDAGVSPGSLNGKPGTTILKRAGSEVSQLPGVAMDNQVFKERQQSKEDIDLISGAMNILKGDKPGSVTAASALEMLFEVGLGKLRPALDRWKWFIESSQRKQLKLIHDNYKEQRPAFTRLLVRKNRDLSVAAINAFLGSSLAQNYSVVIEAGSHIPKLQSSQRSLLLEMAQRGVLGLENPQNQSEFNKRFGIVGFDTQVGPDVNRAKWENDCIENIHNTPDAMPFVLLEDNHDIHLLEHWNLAKTPRFRDLDPQIQNLLFQHIQEHDNTKLQKMQEQMMQQGMMAGPDGSMPEPQAPSRGSIGQGTPSKEEEMQAITGSERRLI